MKVEIVSKNVFRVPENPNCHVDPRGLGVLFMERMKKYKDNVAQVSSVFSIILLKLSSIANICR